MNARLYLDSRASKGVAPIKVAITHDGKTAYIPTGVKILPEQWEKDPGLVVKHENKKDVNMFLRSRLSFVEKELLRLQELGKTRGRTIVEVKDMVLCKLDPNIKAKKEKENTFLYRLERYRNLQTKEKTISTFDWTIGWLKKYDCKLESRLFEDINVDYLKDFLAYCHNLSVNSKAILLRNIRSVFNDAIDAGITECYPFRRMSIKTEKTRKKALTIPMLRKLKDYPCCVWNAEYRDMFMLMFYLRGINAVDLFSARLTQVVNGRLEYRRSKVGTLFSIKIEPEAMEIIERYKGKEYLINPLERYKSYSDYLHHMNDGLKTIGCERTKRNKIIADGPFRELSSNWARHTWATVCAELDITDPTITLGMGHSTAGHRVTAIYIKRDMKKVDEANRKVIDCICRNK